jgi:capsular polysaccharide transport system permease protein
MIQPTNNAVEKRFAELQAKLTDRQLSDEEFLLDKVRSLEQNDLALACRLMLYIRDLSPSSLNNKRYVNFQQRLQESNSFAPEEQSNLSGVSSTAVKSKHYWQVVKSYLWNEKTARLRQPLIVLVLIPLLLFSVYQILIASPRYESSAQLIIKEPNAMATLDPAMAVMSGFGIAGANSEAELVKAFILSNDMLIYLDEKLEINEHFSNEKIDMFSRLSSDASRESQYQYFLDRVLVEIEEKSQIIHVDVQGFDPDFTRSLSEEIVSRAEWYINEIGRNLAKEQLNFVQQEHELVQGKLRDSKALLLDFQRRFDLLDPEAEGAALQQIAYQLEGLVAAKQTELRTMRTSMSDSAPLIMQAKAELDSLVQQLEKERRRLTEQSSDQEDVNSNALSVGEILAKYSGYKIDLELALQAYTSSLVSLEKSRIEAYRQIKYLVVVETSTLPEDASYPQVFYNISLFLAIFLMVFGIGKIILATVEELR